MDDFEQFLTSQPLRAVPPEWREEILATATAAAGRKPTASEPGWRAWLWPSPYAWGALAAVWLVILGLNFAAQPARKDEIAGGFPPTNTELLASIGEHRRELEEFFPIANAMPRPPPAKPPNSPGASLDQPKSVTHSLV